MDTVPILVWISLATNCFSVGKELKEICEFEIQKDAKINNETNLFISSFFFKIKTITPLY
jgi:hypothetical protein